MITAFTAKRISRNSQFQAAWTQAPHHLRRVVGGLRALPNDCDARERLIAEETWRTAHRDIYVMDPDGSNEAKLPTIFGDANFPAWSPDGTKIAFLAGLDIYVMNADGSNGQLLTTADSLTTDDSGTNYIDEWPTWSPGNKIAFNSNRKDGSPGYVGGDYINTMSPDGSNIVQLPSGIEAHQPSWSPGGDMITFPSSPKVYKMNSDGSSVTELATGYDPSWSKDGNMIAFAQYVYTPGPNCIYGSGVCTEIFVMNADGTNQTRLTTISGQDRWPDWSP